MHFFQKKNSFLLLKTLTPKNKQTPLIKTQLRTLIDFDPKKDYYKILSVSPDAGEKEIKVAYHKMAKKHHPDLNDGKQSNEFKEMTNAYDILSDSNKKKDYDVMRKSESQPNPFYSNPRQKAGFTGNTNYNTGSSEYYDEEFEQKIREKFRRAGFNNDKFSKFQYKDPKTGEWKSYASAQGNPFFKDFEDLFKKASQQQQNKYRNSNSYGSNYSGSQTSQYSSDFKSESIRSNEQFHSEDLNDPNRFANMGYNPYSQNTNENNNGNNASNINNNSAHYNKNGKGNGNFNAGGQNEFNNNFNYDYTPIILQQFARRAIIVFGVFLFVSLVFKKKAGEDYYFNNGLGNSGVNQSYYEYSQSAKKKEEKEVDPYDANAKIKVK